MYAFLYFISDFNHNFNSPACQAENLHQATNSLNQSFEAPTVALNATNVTTLSSIIASPVHTCLKENSILFLLLMLGTVWVGITMYNFTQT